MIQMINFFLFTVMMEIFLTYFGKGSTLAQSSLGSLVFKSADSISIIGHLNNNGMHQHILLTIIPFIFIIC